MDNSTFLQVLKESFVMYLKTGARSNEKLKVLHGAIAKDIFNRLGDKKYSIASLGFENGKEVKIKGRYIDKAVDITVCYDKEPIAGFAVKYVMSNYSQNSNNYFENMLGETANIRTANIPYFQMFIIPDKIPYFDDKNEISKWERISQHNIQKYVHLSNDNTDSYFHTPNKTLVFIIHINNNNDSIKTKKEYFDYYLGNEFDIELSKLDFEFGRNVIYNDYESFAEKSVHLIKSL